MGFFLCTSIKYISHILQVLVVFPFILCKRLLLLKLLLELLLVLALSVYDSGMSLSVSEAWLSQALDGCMPLLPRGKAIGFILAAFLHTSSLF